MKLRAVENALDEVILEGTAASGLRVLIHPRPGFVRTFAALGVNFGSVDRHAGGNGGPVPEGLAHFLEHKLFEDEHGDVSDRFAELGAGTNAMTGFCGTTYITSAVADAGRCLDLLLDFVQTPYFTDELVAKEQGIIAQEIRLYDDDPDWRVFFGLLGCLYSRHPVRDNIAGTVASIAEIDSSTLRRCYDLFYHPRNMCLVVSGALEPQDVCARVEADQAGREKDSRPAHHRTLGDEPAAVAQERWTQAMPVSRPRLLMGIKEGQLGGGGAAVLRRELSTRILLDVLFGRSSTAFQEMYGQGLIDESFGVSHSAEESFGFTTIGGETDEPERLEAAVRAVFERALKGGLDAAAFGRIRNKIYGNLLRSVDSPEHVAYELLSDTFRGTGPFEALAVVDHLSLQDLHARLAEHVQADAIAVALLRPAER